MRIVYNCPACHRVNRMKERASNRYKLYEKIGEEVSIQCSKCHQKNKIHINRVYAKVDPVIISLVILGLSTASVLIGRYLLQTYWRNNILIDLKTIEATVVGVVIPLLILSIALPSIGRRASNFNSYRL